MIIFSTKQFFQAIATTLLLLVGLPQFVAPILGLTQFSGAAIAQTSSSVRLSRQVTYNNANSPDSFQDDRLTYSFSLENIENTTITGVPVNIDGQTVNRVMVASVIPAGTYLAGVSTPPAGWQVIYSTDERLQTGRRNNDSRITWSTYEPIAHGAARIAFVKTAVSPYEITNNLRFSLLLEDIPAYAPGVSNTAEVYGNIGGTPALIANNDNFYTDIQGIEQIEVARNRSGKPVAEAPTELPLVAELPTETPTALPLPDPIQVEEDPIEVAEPAPIISPQPPEPIAQTPEPVRACSFDSVPAQFSVGVSSASGGTDAYPSITGFLPIDQTPGQNLTYVNAATRLDDFENIGTNVTLGHRFYDGDGDRIYGGHLSYDLGNQQDTTFNQVGVGIETLGQVWDASLNMYVPLEGEKTIDNGTKTIDPLTTVEAEVSAQLLSLENGGEVRAYVSPYYYTELNTVGARVGLTAEPIDGITVGASVQTDEVFDTQVGFNINYTIGRSSRRSTASDSDDFAVSASNGSPCGRLDRLVAPIRRTSPIRVQVEDAIEENVVAPVGLQTETEDITEPLTCLPDQLLIGGECLSVSVSDRTLKENIEYLGETESGFKLYAFDYIKHFSLPTGRFVGVMAQDLLQEYPEAVVTQANNTYAVNYTAIGLRMAAYDQWEEFGLEAVMVGEKNRRVI